MDEGQRRVSLRRMMGHGRCGTTERLQEGRCAGSEQVGFEACDEGQTGGDDFVEAAVVGEEEVDA